MMNICDRCIRRHAYVRSGGRHRARTGEGHKLVASFVDHKTANWEEEEKISKIVCPFAEKNIQDNVVWQKNRINTKAYLYLDTGILAFQYP